MMSITKLQNGVLLGVVAFLSVTGSSGIIAASDGDSESPEARFKDSKPAEKETGVVEKATIATALSVNVIGFGLDKKTIMLAVLRDAEVYDIASGNRTHAMGMGVLFRGQAVPSPEGKSISWVSPHGGAHVWTIGSDKKTHVMSWPGPRIDPDTGESTGPRQTTYAGIAVDGKTAATLSGGDEISIWDIATSKVTNSFNVGGPVMAFAMSPDGKRLAIVKKTLEIWDVTSGKKTVSLLGLDGNPDHMEVVQFSADSKFVVAPSHRHSFLIWDAEKGQLLHKFALKNKCRAFSLSPNAKMLAIAERDTRLRILEVATGRELATLNWVSFPGDVAWSADSTFLASVRENRVRIWDVSGIAPGNDK